MILMNRSGRIVSAVAIAVLIVWLGFSALAADPDSFGALLLNPGIFVAFAVVGDRVHDRSVLQIATVVNVIFYVVVIERLSWFIFSRARLTKDPGGRTKVRR